MSRICDGNSFNRPVRYQRRRRLRRQLVFVLGFLGDEPHFAGFNRLNPVLPNEFYWFHFLLWRFTGFYWLLLAFTGFYLVLLGFTGFYWVLPSFTEFYRVLPGFTGSY